MIGLAASGAAGQEVAPGLFLLVWGLFASVVGLALVTDFRGFVQGFTQSAYDSPAWMRRIPPWKWMRQRPDELARRAKLNRLLGIPFAVLGPIMTVVGLVQILRGHLSVPRGPALPLPFALAFIGIAVLAMIQYWRPRGLFRHAARRGGGMRAAAIFASVGAVSFGVFMALGLTTLGIAGSAVCGRGNIFLMMPRRPDPTQRPDADVSPDPAARILTQPRDPANPKPGEEGGDDSAAFRWL